MVSLRGLSLRRKLPLLVSAVAAGALILAGTFAYAEVRASAYAAAEARLVSVREQLERLSEQSATERAAREERIAASPVVRAALRGVQLDTSLLFFVLDSLRQSADGGLPVSLVEPDGNRVFTIGALPVASDPDPNPPLKSERAYGQFRPVDGQALYWRTIPVRGEDGTPIAWIAQRRRMGGASSGGVIEQLVGSGIRIRLGQVADSLWVNLDGAFLEEPPARLRILEPYVYRQSDGSESLAVVAPLASSPWLILIERPMSEVMARPHTFLRRMIGIGSLLILATVFVAWLASRRLTAPIEALAVAADAVAAGDYGRRVRVDGTDEVGLLARAFNQMGEQVARSDEELRTRLDEARRLARELEEAHTIAEQARAEAQAASRAKSEFLAHMSHEVRTPINAVIGYTELLKLGIPDPPTEQQAAYLDRIDRSSQLLIALIDDVLDFSRIESGQTRIEPSVGCAREVVQAAVAALQPDAARKGISLTTECVVDSGFFGDPQRTQQILMNFVSNAVKFTPEGGSVRIGCTDGGEGPPGQTTSEGEWLRFDVEDTGIGIEPDQVARVFEPFVQVESGLTREHGGAGLGLAISRRLASMMDGDITVESTPGRGSRFTLWLRTAAAHERVAAS